jgi:hypothetical protein
MTLSGQAIVESITQGMDFRFVAEGFIATIAPPTVVEPPLRALEAGTYQTLSEGKRLFRVKGVFSAG